MNDIGDCYTFIIPISAFWPLFNAKKQKQKQKQPSPNKKMQEKARQKSSKLRLKVVMG